MPLSRRLLLSSIGASFLPKEALSQIKFSTTDQNGNEFEEQVIMRRPAHFGEDPIWYSLTQNGPYNVQKPINIPFKSGKFYVTLPKSLQTAPLVVFSHGALTFPEIYLPLMAHWASHGFFVVAPIHDDSILERGLLARRATVKGSAIWEVDKVLNDVNAWDSRTELCRVALEHIDLFSNAVGMKADISKPIIVGHEFGAFVAQLLLGAKVTTHEGKLLDFKDDRWFAALAIAGQGAGVMGLDKNSWTDIKRPLMVIQGEKDYDFTGQDATQKSDGFLLSQPGNKHLGWFPEGAKNLATGPRAGIRQSEITQFEDFKALTTLFLKSYANYDEKFFKLLASDWTDRVTLKRVMTRYR